MPSNNASDYRTKNRRAVFWNVLKHDSHSTHFHLLARFDSFYANYLHTIPVHFRAYHTIPKHSAVSARLDGSLNLNFCQTKHIPLTAFHYPQNNNEFEFLLYRHIPIPLHSVIGIFFSVI